MNPEANRTLHLLALAALTLAGAPAGATPAKRQRPAPARPAPKLTSISVAPVEFRLVGPRAEQGLVVTGHYADGSLRDLTPAAVFRVSGPRVGRVGLSELRRVIRPVGDGSAAVAVTIPGVKPVSVPFRVERTAEPDPVSFRGEVVPALTKAGCSQGVCHGTPTGKGGFRLSLQGYNPDLDYQTLVREGGGRRLNKRDPGRSLLLLKAMVELPHGGGKRLSPDLPEFDVLVRWIGEGLHDDPAGAPALTRLEILPGPRALKLPGAKQQVAAIAHFSDGTVRDVTRVAKLSTSDEDAASITRDGMVEGRKRGDVAVIVRYRDELVSSRLTLLEDVPGFRWTAAPENNFVDRYVFARLKELQIPASGLSSDIEFLRRAYLDAIGLLPTAEEVRAFRSDPSPDRRKKLIDALTERPEFADYWAVKWADVLRIQDESLQETGAKAYHGWIRENLAANKPFDQFVREVLTASGPAYSNPPANYFRALKELDDGTQAPAIWAQSTAQLFFGVRITCAKCHNHPFERWTQDDYYSLAAFFAQVKERGSPRGEATVYLDPKGEVTHLRTGKVMRPKLLGAEVPNIAPGQDRRPVLAEWLTRKDNPFFAKSVANRVWANLLGRGIVEPIDDFRDSNPPVNAPLIDALGLHFAASGFDFRQLVRTIMYSRTYQLSSRVVPLNKTDTVYFSHANTRLLSAEQLSDAIGQVTGVWEQFPGYPAGTRAVQLAGTKSRTPFLKTFGRPDRNLTCECEREKDPTLFQALALISGRSLDARLKSDESRLAKLAQSPLTHDQLLEELYLSAFARPPSAREKQQWLSHFGKASNRRQAVEDLGWVLVNSKEFLFRH